MAPSETPTPPSGLPAVTTDRTDVLLDVMEKLQADVHALRRSLEERLRRLEGTDETLGHEIKRLQRRLDDAEEQIRKLRENERATRQTLDEERLEIARTVEGLKRHVVDFTTGVQTAMETAAKAAAERDRVIEEERKEHREAMAEMRASVAKIASAIGHPILRVALVVCACVGAFAGGAYAGYRAAAAAALSSGPVHDGAR